MNYVISLMYTHINFSLSLLKDAVMLLRATVTKYKELKGRRR